MIQGVHPGRVIEYDDDLYLVEKVSIGITAQKIVTQREAMKEVFETGHSETVHRPIFIRLDVDIDENGAIAGEVIKPLYTQDEM